MTIESVDWEKVQSIVDSMRNNSEENDPQQTLLKRVRSHIQQFEDLVDEGWPYQEIAFDKHEEPIGIPIDLAYMLLGIFEFCAYANIDLGGAIRLTQQNV